MALSKLSQIGDTLQRGAEYEMSPLKAIEAKRAQRVKESQAQQLIDIDAQKAKASQLSAEASSKSASTSAAEAERKAADAKEIKERMEALNKLYKPNENLVPGSPEYLHEAYIYANKLKDDANPAVSAVGMDQLAKIEAMMQGTQPGGASMGEQRMAAGIQKDQAEARQAETQADLNANLYNRPPEGASKDQVAQAYQYIKENDPTRHDLIPFNAKSEEELMQEARILAGYMQIVQTEYAAATGGKLLDPKQAFNAALAKYRDENTGNQPTFSGGRNSRGQGPQNNLPQAQPQPQGQPTKRVITYQR